MASGCVFGVVGLNGAGKSTLIDVVTGVVRPTYGRARVLGRDVRRDGAAVRALIGVLPQESALYRELTGTQNLRFAEASPEASASPITIPCDGTVGAGASSFTVRGACHLDVSADAECVQFSGEMTARFQGTLPDGVQVSFSVDFEHFHGAGAYTNMPIHFELDRGLDQNFWGTDDGRVTVASRVTRLVLAMQTVPAAVGTSTPDSPVTVAGELVCKR